MKVKSKFWLEDESGETIFGEGRRKILELIEELGSMQATAKALSMSYRGVWARIKATEERLQMKLVETSVGRGKDRGSKLTPEAKKLLRNYKTLTEKGNAHTDELYDVIFLEKGGDMVPSVPSVGVVGPAGSGKDELTAELVKLMTQRGRRVAVLKPESEAESSSENKKWLANGATTVIRTKEATISLSFPEAHELTNEMAAANYALGCDMAFVIAEEKLHLPTIEIYKQELSDSMITRMRKHILAVVGDTPAGKEDLPCFGMDRLEAVAECVDKQILEPLSRPRVRLLVDGRRTPMLPFVENIFFNAVSGMVSSLKSCEKFRDIELIITNSDE